MGILQTAERSSHLDPSENVIFQRHLIAYKEVANLVSGTVLEIGSGEGYGIIELAPKAEHYIAIDKYETLISDELKVSNNITFIQSEVPPLKGIEEDMQGSFSGIGVQFNIIEDSIVVVAAISGGPSEELGIQSGDRIIEVEGENVASINIKNEDVIEKLRGEKGTTVNIKILRRNSGFLEFSIIRDNIPLYSVDASIMLTSNIGYIKVNRFSATTFDEFKKGTNKLIDKGMKHV